MPVASLFKITGLDSLNQEQWYLDNIGMRRLFSRLTLEGLLARLRFRRFCAIILVLLLKQ